MSNRPRGSPAASTSAPSAATTSRRICRAGPTKALPAAVSTMPRPMRWKSYAELPLQSADRLGNGGLRQLQGVRRSVDPVVVHDGQEVLHLVQLHGVEISRRDHPATALRFTTRATWR